MGYANHKAIDMLRSRIITWDLLAESGQLSTADVERREVDVMELRRLEQIERDMLKQKSRIRWGIEGDENTKYFHASLKNKFRKSRINGLNCNGAWSENPEYIKSSVFNHFSSRFKEPVLR